MDRLGIKLGFYLFQVFNFTILALVLYGLAYKPIVKMLEDRKLRIAKTLEDSEVAAEARANAEKDAEKVIAEAQSKATQIINEATSKAETAAKQVKADAEADIAQAREAALAEAEQARDRTLADVRGQIAALAMAATQKLVGETLDDQRQHALIDEFFSGVKSGEVVLLADQDITGASAEITSALPLTPEEQETVKKDVLAKIGDQATISFRVDPSILGGLIIRIGDKVLDGSVSGQLEDMRQNLG